MAKSGPRESDHGLHSPRHRIGGAGSAGAGSNQKVAGLYDLEETLGEGHYAVVKSARHVFTGERVAVKVIDKMKLDAATRLQMMQEVRLMKLVQHPHVVRLYEVIDTHTKLYLILELADGGDMYDYIMKHEAGLEEEIAKKYFRQIVHAIQYCHQLHVVHRDLKPENVVFFEKLGLVKLADFGFSNKFDPGQQLQTSCGSLAYSAPEILLGDAYDAPAVDVWSLGVILYMLVCGTAPFQEANDSETLTMIMDCKYSFPNHISSHCKSLISRMLQRQPNSRASLADIVNDPWLGCKEEISASDSSFMLPLVARQHLSEEEHNSILQKMVAGSIASKEEIIDALDRNEYNHITATYFLLAERKLRSQRLDIANKKQPTKQSPPNRLLSRPVKIDINCTTDKQDTKDLGEKPANVSGWLSPPEESPKQGSSTLSRPSMFPAMVRFRARKCSIVEENEEDEMDEEDEVDDDLDVATSRKKGSPFSSSKQLSLSSNNIPLDSLHEVTCSIQTEEKEIVENPAQPPAPFPLTSQIGSGNLGRQNSLRKGQCADTSTSSERSSPSTPPGSTTSSSHSSPARYKMSLANRKLVSTRSSPQLMHSAPFLKEIHEEVEEGSPPVDPVDSFPTSRAGAAVIRRLEHRRKIRLHKARTASCSSSDASDDDSAESRKKRSQTGSPCIKRETNNDDSSDNQDSGMGRAGGSRDTCSSNSRCNVKTSTCQEDKTASTSGQDGNQGRQTHGIIKEEREEDLEDHCTKIIRKMSMDSTDSSEWEDDYDRRQSVEVNTGLQILKHRLDKIRQKDKQETAEVERRNMKNLTLHRAHSCSSLFSLQQGLVRHRRLSCQVVVPATVYLDILGEKSLKQSATTLMTLTSHIIK